MKDDVHIFHSVGTKEWNEYVVAGRVSYTGNDSQTMAQFYRDVLAGRSTAQPR